MDEPKLPPSSGTGSRDAVSELVVKCLERMEKEGTAAIDRICEEYPEHSEALRAQLENLERMGLLNDPNEDTPESELPERLGDFRVLRRLGGGGMGVVYLAEQESLKRQVALKMIRPEHLYFPKARARFVREIEAIARLSHPGIVQIFAAGEAQKIPYFAMEVVDGISLQRAFDAFANKDPRDLTGRDLVKLVLGDGATNEAIDRHPWAGMSWIVASLTIVKGIGEALAHAHGHDILHRDIKPSNVMLTRDGRAVLLDFGLATTSGASRLTVTGSVLGSIYYMTPEQISGRGDAVDMRADVWGLGVVLYELLTLRLPFAGDDVETVRSRILFEEPIPLRDRNSALSWDVETVCMCALEKDRARRYATMDAFVRDLHNVLELQPIDARRASLPRRVMRWTQRHPAKATAAALAFVVFVLGPLVVLGVVLRKNAEIQAGADEVEARSRETEEMFQFQKDMLTSIQPGEKGRDVKVATMLEDASKKAGTRFVGKPLIEAKLRSMLCETWLALGILDEAEIHATRAVELFDEGGAGDLPDALIAQARLGSLRFAQGRTDEARRLIVNAADRLEAQTGPDDVRVASIRMEIANQALTGGRYDEAESNVRRAHDALQKELAEADRKTHEALAHAEDLQKKYGETDRRTIAAGGESGKLQEAQHETERMTLAAQGILSQALYYRGDYVRAEAELRKLIEAKSKAIGENHPDTLVSKQTLAVVLDANGKSQEAVDLCREVAAEQERQLGPDHAHFLVTLNTLASFLDSTYEYEECESLRRRVVEARARTLGAEHPDTVRAQSNLAHSLLRRDKTPEARPLIEQIVEAATRVLGPDHVDTLKATARLGSILLQEKRFDEAVVQFDRAIDGAGRSLGKEHPTTCEFRQSRVLCLPQIGRLDEVVTEMRDVEAILEKRFGPDHVNVLRAESRFGFVLLQEKRFDEALPHFERAIEGSTQSPGMDDPVTCDFRLDRAACRAQLGPLDEGIAEMLDVESITEKRFGPDHFNTLKTDARVGNILFQCKRFDDALPHLEHAIAGAMKTLGKDHMDTCEYRQNRALCLAQLGRVDEAVAEMLEVEAILDRVFGPDHYNTLKANARFGNVLLQGKRFDEAMPRFDHAIEGATRALGKDHSVTCDFREDRATCLAQRGRFDEAVAELLDVEAILEKRFGLSNMRTQDAVKRLVEIYALSGKTDEANRWRAKIAAKQ